MHPVISAALVLLAAAACVSAQTINPTPSPPPFFASGMTDTKMLSNLDNNAAYIFTKLLWLPDGRILLASRNCTFWIASGTLPLNPSVLFQIPTCQSPGEIG